MDHPDLTLMIAKQIHQARLNDCSAAQVHASGSAFDALRERLGSALIAVGTRVVPTPRPTMRAHRGLQLSPTVRVSR